MRAVTVPVAFVAAVVLLASGCTASDLAVPVPTAAAAPYLCDGVPLTGLERMTRTSDLAAEDIAANEWDSAFLCQVSHGDRLVASVLQVSLEGRGSDPVDEQIAEARTRSGALQIVADAPGAGYVVERDDETFARWVCEDNTRTDVTVYVDSDPDLEEDLARYMVSILPWACGDAEAPPRTVED